MKGEEEALREFDLIHWIRQRAARDERVIVGIGDDTAVLRSPDGPLLFSTDMLLDGVHFALAEATPRQVGWKALACSVSDIAAMGGRSTVAVVAAALPPGFTEADAHELVLGMLDCAEEFGLRLVGGDVTATRGPLAVSVAILGEPVDEPVLRSGAQVGDAILVTGELGGSRLGKHLTFRPRQDEAVTLVSQFDLHAMIDISDGLARDLHHILEESGVGARVFADAIPVSDDARRAAETTGRTALDHALGDGEDYELLFTLAPPEAERLVASPPFHTRFSRIGQITASGALLEFQDGSTVALEPKGWEHTT